MTKSLTNKETAELLLHRDNYLIFNHRRPDGDAVGCAAALCRGLRAMEKTAWVYRNPQTTPRYLPYLQGLETDTVPEGACIVSVDTATPGLFPLDSEFDGKVVLSIDHHMSNEGYAEYTNVHPASAACGEMILDILEQMHAPVSKETAEALYLAISTDTGCFQYSNVTSDTFRAAARLKDLGADTFPINKIMFGTKTIARLRLEAALTESVTFYAGGLVGVCTLTGTMLDALGATEDDVDDISGFPRTIEGVQVGVMIRELDASSTKISLRTGEDYNASAICALLGGGGHRAAAGATVQGTVEDAKRQILAAIESSGVTL